MTSYKELQFHDLDMHGAVARRGRLCKQVSVIAIYSRELGRVASYLLHRAKFEWINTILRHQWQECRDS